MEFHAYRLSKVKPAAVELTNAASLCALPEQIGFGNGVAAVQMYRMPPVVQPACTVRLTVNGEPTNVYLSHYACMLAHEVFSKADTAQYTEHDVPADVAAAILETLLTPILEALSRTLGLPIECEDIVFDQAATDKPMLGLHFNISVEGREIPPLDVAVAPGNDAVARIIAQGLANSPKHANGCFVEALASVPLRASFIGSEMTLSRDETASLEAGDVLILESWLPKQNALTLHIDSGNRAQLQAPCSLNGTQVTLTGSLSQIPENTMSDTNDLAVNLTFELETRTVTLAELQSVQEGYTFTLTSEPNSPVTIRANGKAIAKGRLVDLNGSIGVQVTEAID